MASNALLIVRPETVAERDCRRVQRELAGSLIATSGATIAPLP